MHDLSVFSIMALLPFAYHISTLSAHSSGAAHLRCDAILPGQAPYAHSGQELQNPIHRPLIMINQFKGPRNQIQSNIRNLCQAWYTRVYETSLTEKGIPDGDLH